MFRKCGTIYVTKEREVTMKRYHKDVYFPVFLDLDGFLKNLPQLTYSRTK